LGSGLRQDFGNRSERAVAPLRSTHLSGVVEYDPPNQVIAAGAGMSLGSLQDVLAEHGQWLPLRPPLDGQTTVGGIAALNACGPERLRYGAPRDLALGLKFVSGTGRLVSAGGRVVKNVTGYDVTRLLVGSAGTLGFITEVTFRVAPIPRRCVAVVASGTWDQCQSGAAELLRSQLEPNLIVAEPLGGGLRTCQFIAGFEGFEETVAFQTERCDALLAGAGLSVEEHAEYAAGEGACKSRVGVLQFLDEADFVLRVDLAPDGVVPFLSAHKEVLCEPAAMADLGCGRIMAPRITLSGSVWTDICEAARQAGGHAILEKAPTAFRDEHDMFGPPRADWQLMHKIKAALDPHDVFAPGRLPGRK
jgi:FAD/FMN-containing dehydrogenase